jgi:hypothetical protein
MRLCERVTKGAGSRTKGLRMAFKAFSSFNLPRHRSPINACIHLIAALTAYQLNPIHTQHYMKITAS